MDTSIDTPMDISMDTFMDTSIFKSTRNNLTPRNEFHYIMLLGMIQKRWARPPLFYLFVDVCSVCIVKIQKGTGGTGGALEKCTPPHRATSTRGELLSGIFC